MSLGNDSVENVSRLQNLVQEKAIDWGADLIGFANVERFKQYPPKNQPPARTKTVIVLAIWMEDPILDLWLHLQSWKSQQKPPRAFEDEILRGTALRLSLLLERAGYWAEPAAYEPGIYLKEASVLAGLGFIGKNNLLITPEYGSRVRLRAVNTSAPLKPNPILDSLNSCQDCNLCIGSCPANALDTGKFNREACLSYCQANLKEVSPSSVLWCMRCSIVCPIGKDRTINKC